jgi:predicted MFS family arabinose efflux permease
MAEGLNDKGESFGTQDTPLLQKDEAAAITQLTTAQHIGLSFYWLPTTLTFASLAAIIMPDQIATMSAENSTAYNISPTGHVAPWSKSNALGVLIVLGAIAQFVGPFIAALSDGTHSPLGNRRFYLVVGTLLLCPGLLIMAWAKNYFLYLFGYIIYQIFSTVAVQPFTAVVADCVPEDQRGTASGWIGLMQFLGNLMGSILGVVQGENYLSVVDVYLMIVATCLIGMVVGTIYIQDDTSPRPPPSSDQERAGGGARETADGATDDAPFTSRLMTWPSFPSISLCAQLRGFIAAFRASRSFCYLFVVAAVATSAASVYTLYLQYYLKDIIEVQPKGFSAFGQHW